MCSCGYDRDAAHAEDYEVYLHKLNNSVIPGYLKVIRDIKKQRNSSKALVPYTPQ
jgi:hypothetical protein